MRYPPPSSEGWVVNALGTILQTTARLESRQEEIIRRQDMILHQLKKKDRKSWRTEQEGTMPWYRDKTFLVFTGILVLMLSGHITFEQLANLLVKVAR